MQQNINAMHSREMKMRFKQIRKPLEFQRSPSSFQEPEEFSEKDNNFHNMSTRLNADFQATSSQHNSQDNEEIAQVQIQHISIEAMKNELLLARLKAMAVKNQSKRQDLISCDINMINKCLQNLALYYSKDQEKLQTIGMIKEKLSLLG